MMPGDTSGWNRPLNSPRPQGIWWSRLASSPGRQRIRGDCAWLSHAAYWHDRNADLAGVVYGVQIMRSSMPLFIVTVVGGGPVTSK